LDLVMSFNTIAWGMANWDNLVKPTSRAEAAAQERREASFKKNWLRKFWSKIWKEVLNASTLPLRKEVRVLYLDTDLCITSTVTTVGDIIFGTGGKNDIIDTRRIVGGEEGILHVYTKSDAWAAQFENKRSKVRFAVATVVPSKVSPVIRPGVRKRLMEALRKRGQVESDTGADFDGEGSNESQKKADASSPPSSKEKVEQGYELNKSTITSITAFRLGEYDISPDGSTKEDVTWDGEEDPFVHLSPDERQRVLKQMEIKDIKEAGRVHRLMNRRERGRRTNKAKPFRKPSDDSFLGHGI